MKIHTYYFKGLYDDNNCVTGKFEKGWTGRIAIEATKREDAIMRINDEFQKQYPNAKNIRNIKAIN